MSKPRARVTFANADIVVEVPLGTTIREAAALAGVSLNAPCGGLGTCGRCSVAAVGALETPGEDERLLVPAAALAGGVRLACRARVAGDVSVSRVGVDRSASLRIVEAGSAGALSIEPPSARGICGAEPLLGAVVDIGTTTVVVAIVDLSTGTQLGSAAALNPQHPFGHDVMSRITHTASHGPDSLRQPILSAIESLALSVLADLGEPAEHLRELAIAGNTTMIHLLLGIDPAPLGTAPYEPAFLAPMEVPASEVGLLRLPAAQVYIVPGISAFVGADITAGLLVTRLAERDRPTMLIDLGTNGEIVIRTSSGLLASSTAAGPALEGASIAYGMRAEEGAIERVSLDCDELAIATIGDAPAKGLCGSGLLDLIAILLDTGVVAPSGRLQTDAAHPLAARVSERDGTRAFEVASGVYLTQRDVRQVQLANAAIASGLLMLLDAADVSADDVAELVIAGGFGYHVRADALVRMGMIPAAWAGRVTFAGNTAMSGTLQALLDSNARRGALAIARHVTTVDLASQPDFQNRFVSAMTFPATQPSVAFGTATVMEELT